MADDVFIELRPLLFSIAYRMVGTVTEAEDLVQEAFVRFERARRAGTVVESPKAYLVSVTTRLAIDYLRSARVRRESYVGPWLPEPLVTGSAADQTMEQTGENVVEMGESLSMAFLVLLERLSPVERAVFVLREVFGYGYDEIGDIVGKTEANCRQIFARARQHVVADRPRFAVSRQEQEQLVHGFLAACEHGDVAGLVRLLADDVAFHADGGGKAAAAAKPVYGRDRVGRLLARLLTIITDLRLRLRPADVNGQPGAVVLDPDGHVVNVVAFDVSDDAITGIWSVANPDKLERVQL